jgi:hypothetical protein
MVDLERFQRGWWLSSRSCWSSTDGSQKGYKSAPCRVLAHAYLGLCSIDHLVSSFNPLTVRAQTCQPRQHRSTEVHKSLSQTLHQGIIVIIVTRAPPRTSNDPRCTVYTSGASNLLGYMIALQLQPNLLSSKVRIVRARARTSCHPERTGYVDEVQKSTKDPISFFVWDFACD